MLKTVAAEFDGGEIVQDKYLPSYLVLAHDGSEAFHVLFATDVAEEHVRVVTAYRPSTDEWENDGKTRRTRQ